MKFYYTRFVQTQTTPVTSYSTILKNDMSRYHIWSTKSWYLQKMEVRVISTSIDTLSRSKKIFTDEEVDDCIAIVDKLNNFSIEQYTEDDFYTDGHSIIHNKNYYDSCPFLFVIWHDDATPIMVFNGSVVEGLSREERENEWGSVWDCMYYNKSKHPNVDWYRSPRWNDMVFYRLQKHMWWFWFGMY